MFNKINVTERVFINGAIGEKNKQKYLLFGCQRQMIGNQCDFCLLASTPWCCRWCCFVFQHTRKYADIPVHIISINDNRSNRSNNDHHQQSLLATINIWMMSSSATSATALLIVAGFFSSNLFSNIFTHFMKWKTKIHNHSLICFNFQFQFIHKKQNKKQKIIFILSNHSKINFAILTGIINFA